MQPLKIALIGAGERGAHCYAPYALKYPAELSFVAVAEPETIRRDTFAKQHGIASGNCFISWEELLAANLELDAVLVANQDKHHYEPVMQALQQGYHVLCEKPMAETFEKSRQMVQAAEKAGKLLMVCHVLRYTPFFTGIKKQIDDGIIGKVQAVHHLENIGNWHFAHSYVRGNWHNTNQSTPMIVAKCCHDMDILNFLIDKPCKQLTSFGSLSYFTKENAPPNAALKCTDCTLNKNCNFSSYHYYEQRDTYAPFKKILENAEGRRLEEILPNSPYNQCVYHCNNNAVDHQTVQMEYEGGVTVSFTVSAFSADISRQIKIMGTMGEIEGRVEDNYFTVKDFGSGEVTKRTFFVPEGNHAGGDERIMAHFCSALRNPANHPEINAQKSLAGHAMAFAAEISRLKNGIVMDIEQYNC